METDYLDYLNGKYRFPRSLVNRPIQRFFGDYLDRAPDQTRVLDAGCGSGIETGSHANRLQIVGIDFKSHYLATCRATYSTASYLRGDLSDIGLWSGSFELVVFNQVIEHLDNPLVVVAELARVLRPDGVLLVATPNYGGVGWPLIEATYHRWFAKEFDAEENHVTHYRRENLHAHLNEFLTVEHVGTVCAGLILVAVARKETAIEADTQLGPPTRMR